MWINRLKINQFRNLTPTDITLPESGVYVLYGHNGAGKTNLLEALSLLSPGQGLHRAKLDHMTAENSKEWSIFAEISSLNTNRKLGMVYNKKRRQIKLDGEDMPSQAELAKLGSVLWFTPEMDRLFYDSPAARRRFFDRLVFSITPEHALNLNRYTRHIQNRAKLLKENTPDQEWLTIEEQQAAHFGVKVSQQRLNYLTQLQPSLKDVTMELVGNAESIIKESPENSEEETESLFAQTLLQNRSRDARFATTHFGSHRSDVSGVLYTDTPLSRASMGQHKKALLHILIAAAELQYKTDGQPPCILLDEVATHLDETSRDDLYQRLMAMGGQLWLTGTEKSFFGNLQKPYFIRVNNGQITPEF